MIRHIFATVCALMLGQSALAADLPQPQGDIILTVTGLIANTNASDAANFDLAMLSALEGRETRTQTPWHEGTPVFSGPLGAALLDALGAEGSTLRVTALNDYVVDIPVEDLRNFPVIFATHVDGAAMSVREKGPLFVIYPFSEDPSLSNELYFGRSAWQIRQIEIID